MSESQKQTQNQTRSSQPKGSNEATEKKDPGLSKLQKQDLYGTVPSESHHSNKTRSSKLRKGDQEQEHSEEPAKKTTVSQVAATISTKLTQSDVNRVISSQIQKNNQGNKAEKQDSVSSIKTNKRVDARDGSGTPDVSMTMSVEASKSSTQTVSESVKRAVNSKLAGAEGTKKQTRSAKKPAAKATTEPMSLDKLIGVAAKGGSESSEKETKKSQMEKEVAQSETQSPEADGEHREALKTLVKNMEEASAPDSPERDTIKVDETIRRKSHKESIKATVGDLSWDYDIFFPHKPHDHQKMIAKYAITVLEKGRNGIYESPPGTGKTVAMLSTVLGWLYQRQRAGKHLQTQVIYSVTDLEKTGPQILAEIKKLCYKLTVTTVDATALKNPLTGGYRHFLRSPLAEDHATSHLVLVPADLVLKLGPFLTKNHILVVDEAQRTEQWARETISLSGLSSPVAGFPANWDKKVTEFVVPDKRKVTNHAHVNGAILDSEETLKFLNSIFFEGKSNRERTIKSLASALLKASNALDKEAMTMLEENEEAGLTDEVDLLLSWQDFLLTVRELIKDTEVIAIAPMKSNSPGSGLGSFPLLKHYALQIQAKPPTEGGFSIKLVCTSSALSLNPAKDSPQPWAKLYSCLMMSQNIFPTPFYQCVLNLQVDLGYQCPRVLPECIRTFYSPTKLLSDASVIPRVQEVIRAIRNPCVQEGTVLVLAQWRDVSTIKDAFAEGAFALDAESRGFRDPRSQIVDEGDIIATTESQKPAGAQSPPMFFDTAEGTEGLEEYRNSVLAGKGGILITSYPAPLRPTEKIEFPARIGRVVVILGSPNIQNLPSDPYAGLIKKQMDELQRRSSKVIVPEIETPQERISAREWAERVTDRVVPEMMGLGLRDAESHSAIVLLDEKYACNRKKLHTLPKWVQPTLESHQSLESIFLGVTTFLAAPTPHTPQDNLMSDQIRSKLRKPVQQELPGQPANPAAFPLLAPHPLDANYRVRQLEEELRQLRMSISSSTRRRGRRPGNFGMGDFEDVIPQEPPREPRNWKELEKSGNGIKRGEVEGVMKEFLGKRSPDTETRNKVGSPNKGSSRKREDDKGKREQQDRRERRESGNQSSGRDRDRRDRERIQLQDTRNLLDQDRERKGSKSEKKRPEDADRKEQRGERERRDKDEKKESKREEKVRRESPTKKSGDFSVSPSQKQKLRKLFKDEVEEGSKAKTPQRPSEVQRTSGDRRKQVMRDSSDSSSEFEVRGKDRSKLSKILAEGERLLKTTTSSSSRRDEVALNLSQSARHQTSSRR